MNTQHDITVSGKPLTDSTSSICPDCRELEKDW